ncbi:hypothetical protein IKP13_03820 [bacterium]|nr:hypothetical protein [bacterium]
MKKYRSFAVIVYVTETEKQAVMRKFDWMPLRIEGDEQDTARRSSKKTEDAFASSARSRTRWA